LLLALVASWLPIAQAQPHASPPLRILVPLPAGSTSDVVAHLIADGLAAALDKPAIVDDRPGGNGRIAVDELKRAAADGSTILFAPMAVPVTIPLVYGTAYVDPVRDLAPIARVATFEYALAVASDHPARTLREFVAWAKTRAAPAAYGTPAAGSIPHVIGAMLTTAAGVELLHVPYRGGPQVAMDLIGGQIAAGISATSDFAALARGGKLRILATSGAHRSALLPEVPTFAEQGFAPVVATGWNALFAPAKTPPAVIDKLAAAVAVAMRKPALREALLSLDLVPAVTSPRALAETMDTDIHRWRVELDAMGFKAD
jgi:tripartite-type tricarboxylate transporter receptor subunit TctC